MVQKILVPTDGSMASNKAIEYSAGLAKKYEADLIILNVISTNIATAYHGVSAKEQIDDELKKQANRLVNKGISRAKKMGATAEGMIKHGLPDKVILKLAKEHDDVIMVVMGAFGKNFLERRIVGSKTERVVRGITKLKVPLVSVPCPKCLQ